MNADIMDRNNDPHMSSLASSSLEEEEEKDFDGSSLSSSKELEKDNVTNVVNNIHHEAHGHSLILKPAVGVEHADNSLGCSGCWRVIEGSHYACREGCEYFLHALCANSPQKISHHPLHPEHKLVMLVEPPRYPAECRVCGKRCKGFTYHCMQCSGFDIDLLCAWVPDTIQTKAHQHSLSLIPQPAVFSCNACRVEFGNKSFSYMCFTCKYWVHLDCAVDPADFSSIRWGDEYHSPGGVHNSTDVSSKFHCNICDKEVYSFSKLLSHADRYIFGCSYSKPSHRNPYLLGCLNSNRLRLDRYILGCWNANRLHDLHQGRYPLGRSNVNRFFHLGCVALATMLSKSVEERFMENNSPMNTERENFFDRVYFITTTGTVYGHKRCFRSEYRGQGDLKIKHWSHVDHSLKLGRSVDEVPGFDRRRIKCDGCKWPLMAPFYSCMKCNFFLHAGCAAFQKQIKMYKLIIRSIIHGHDLKLELIPEEERGGRQCSNCRDTYSGFSFECQQCDDYRLDLNCAEIEQEIKHPAHHQHQLYFLGTEKPSEKCMCNACGNSCQQENTVYFCSICEFYLHVKCASLPRMSRHRFDHHTLILMLGSFENELKEYICDICEDDKRDPNLWFYGCMKCDFAAHVDCIFNQ